MSTTDGAASRQTSNISDTYDHPIKLIDTTASAEISEADNDALERLDTKDPRWRDIVKRVPTKASVREGLSRRKYAKWQEGRESVEGESGGPSTAQADEAGASTGTETPKKVSVHPQIEGMDFAGTTAAQERGRTDAREEGQLTEVPSKSTNPKARKEKHRKEISEVDILYENQRGSFFCGIPLYSHSSLLNFDPSPWVTKDFKDSPVNITNAQVPDPTWEWAWKTWYVDMSGDVDEEGWQYSFSFSPKFSWHGTHPWIYSFVRRRRWLRKRVKKHSHIDPANPSSMSQAHVLTSDYFTIHPDRNRSRSSDRYTGRSSYISTRSKAGADARPTLEEINDIPTLLRALKLASVDRERIDAVRHFVNQGGEELAYLKESIPTIMSFLVFQNSRRQLLLFLKKAADEASRHRQERHVSQDKPEGAEEQRRIDNLLSAVDAANQQIDGLEYWSDRKHVLKLSDEEEKRPDTAKDSIASAEAQQTRKENPMAEDDIKGIPKQADVGVDPTEMMVKSQAEIGGQVGPDDGGDGKDQAENDDHRDDSASDDQGKDNKQSGLGTPAEEVDKDQEETPVQLPPDAMRIG